MTQAAVARPAPSQAAQDFLARPHQPFIDGVFADARSDVLIQVENPAREEIVASAQASGPEDIDRAVAAARKAFETGWGVMAPKDRAKIMLRFAELLHANAPRVAEIEAIEAGMPIALSADTLAGFCHFQSLLGILGVKICKIVNIE